MESDDMTNATDTLSDKIDIEPAGDADAEACEGGPVIVLGNLNIERDFPKRTYNKMLGTTLHELAHISRTPVAVPTASVQPAVHRRRRNPNRRGRFSRGGGRRDDATVDHA